MQSKTSFFNPTALKKDLTRFAPLWGLYTLCLLLGLLLLSPNKTDYWLTSDFASLPAAMAPINLIYALLAAAVLFGDLFNTRMCNALHAMPLRRESWFLTHVLSGLLFSIVPTLLMALVAMPLLAKTPVTDAWQLALYFFASTNLQYLFFFGTAAFCAQCVGNWIGMAALYGLVNFGSLVLYVLVNTLYTPMLQGVVTQPEPFLFLSPVFQITNDITCLIDMDMVRSTLANGEVELSGSFTLGDGWSYVFGCAALGAGLLAAACLMYRRRKLESAGDFLAIRLLAPVALVGIALVGATGFQFVYTMFQGSQMGMVLFAFVGLAVGWFAGEMLIARSSRVFALRNWIGLAVLAVLLGASLGLTKLDPLGIQTWLPEADQVESITLENGYRGSVTLKDDSGIADLLRLHKLSLEEGLTDDEVYQQRLELVRQEDVDDPYGYFLEGVGLTYKMKDGRTVQRQYNLRSDSESAQIIRKHTSSIAAVFGYRSSDIFSPKTPEELMAYVRKPMEIEFESVAAAQEYLTADTVERLFEAIIADCEAGTLSQCDSFHPVIRLTNYRGGEYKTYSMYLYVKMTDEFGISLNVYADSANVLAWAESVGIAPEIQPVS